MDLLYLLLQAAQDFAGVVTVAVALVTLVGAIIYARSDKREVEQPRQSAGAWPPAPMEK